jgi:hypothetical protein
VVREERHEPHPPAEADRLGDGGRDAEEDARAAPSEIDGWSQADGDRSDEECPGGQEGEPRDDLRAV